MKITTWNLMRPTKGTVTRNLVFHDTIKKYDPDILVLTETNSVINPGSSYDLRATKDLTGEFNNIKYSQGENRAAIFSKFPFGRQLKTHDGNNSICYEVVTPHGSLNVYATVIGVTGGRGQQFTEEFKNQKAVITEILREGDLCVAGDFNISLSGYAYPSNDIIKDAEKFFDTAGLDILTSHNPGCPDHIAISKSFLKNLKVELLPPQCFSKKVTDHCLVSINVIA